MFQREVISKELSSFYTKRQKDAEKKSYKMPSQVPFTIDGPNMEIT